MSRSPAVAPGVFVVFEGGDGAGKSTQLDLLARWLDGAGRRCVRTREPGGTSLGVAVRQAVLHGDHVSARAEALLFAADRAQHVAAVVRPALARGDVVLSDRYMDSSIAYQGAGRELAAQEVRDLSHWATQGLTPELTVLLDIDPDVGRRRQGEAPDRLEAEPAAFHQRVRSHFLELAAAEPGRYQVLDATLPTQRLAELIQRRVAGLIGGAPTRLEPWGTP